MNTASQTNQRMKRDRSVSKVSREVALSVKLRPGALIGDCTVIQKIAESPVDATYMARRLKGTPSIVAIQLFRTELPAEDVIARYAMIRSYIDRIESENVVKVIDVFKMDEKRPVVVSEIVTGVSILEYCRVENTPPMKRLALFAKVCDAVASAHQKGIVHRALRPNNVIISVENGESVPRLTGFGVALSTGSILPGDSGYNDKEELGRWVDYMSPEQLEEDENSVDIRSDVYSLGALLRELLADSIGLSNADVAETEGRELIESACSLFEPHSRMSNLEAEPFWKLTLCEIEAICGRAVEKDRSKRYSSAQSLSEEIHRLLRGEPVSVVEPTQKYRLQKFVQSNRVVASYALCTLVLLIGGVFFLGREVAGKSRSVQRAQVQLEETLDQVNILQYAYGFLSNDILGNTDVFEPDLLRGAGVTGWGHVEEGLQENGLELAGIQGALSKLYARAGDPFASHSSAHRAYHVLAEKLGPDARATVLARYDLTDAEEGLWKTLIPTLHALKREVARRLGERHLILTALEMGLSKLETEGRVGYMIERIVRNAIEELESFADSNEVVGAASASLDSVLNQMRE